MRICVFVSAVQSCAKVFGRNNPQVIHIKWILGKQRASVASSGRRGVVQRAGFSVQQ